MTRDVTRSITADSDTIPLRTQLKKVFTNFQCLLIGFFEAWVYVCLISERVGLIANSSWFAISLKH